VPFVVALFVAAILFRRKAIWVSFIPLISYFLWQVLIASRSPESEDSGINISNLVDFPAWVVEGIAFVFRSLFGNNEAFLNIPWLLSIIFALLFLLAIIFSLIYKKIDPEILIPLSALLTLFLAQTLVAGQDGSSRNVTIERYLYPDAVLFLLTFSYFLKGIQFKSAYFFGTLLTLVIIFSNLVFIAPKNEGMTYVNNWLKAEISAIKIAQASKPAFDLIIKFAPDKKLILRNDFDLSSAESFGELGFDLNELPLTDNSSNLVIDNFLTLNYRLKLLEPVSFLDQCRQYKTGQLINVDSPGIVLSASKPVQVKIGRFSKYPLISLGVLRGEKELLIPSDLSPEPWQIVAKPRGQDLLVCQR
jgi:hypothetical protein